MFTPLFGTIRLQVFIKLFLFLLQLLTLQLFSNRIGSHLGALFLFKISARTRRQRKNLNDSLKLDHLKNVLFLIAHQCFPTRTKIGGDHDNYSQLKSHPDTFLPGYFRYKPFFRQDINRQKPVGDI